ncbi:MAG: ATP-binding cassette domain-containing protein, partial [Anaerolineales bacterium]|nr:ATP-binding cassette domain-containing protein [Anaerolineales bacterium]
MADSHLHLQDLNVWYGGAHSLKHITADIPAHGVTAIIGPSGCGKTTLLRCLNRLLEETPGVRISGQVRLAGQDIYAPDVDVTALRARVGLLAPKPFPLPMSIFDNVAYGPRIHGRRHGRYLAEVVERQLRAAGLWDEVKERLHAPATRLSTGQQQRLCLARSLAPEPEILLL